MKANSTSKPRDLTFGLDARKRLLRGALELARVVSVTYGPAGRNCLLDRMAGLMSTRDGVTVAREVVLPDPVANQGAQILKEACLTVNNEVGDGTTTVAVLAAEMVREGHKKVAAGMDPNQMVRGMNAAAQRAIEFIEGFANSIHTQDQIENVALLASNGDTEVAKNMAEAIMAVGKDGTVSIEDGQTLETVLEFKEGMEIDRGPASSAFLADRTERVMETPLVAVCNVRLRTIEDVRDILETASQWPQHELVIVAQDIAGDALNAMTLNDVKGVVKSVGIIAPGTLYRREDYLQDIAAMSGADFVDNIAGYDHRTWDPEWFGSFRRATIKSKTCTFLALDEAHETIEARIRHLRGQEATCTSDYDRDRMKERLSKLSGGMAILKIGGATEAEMKDRRARVEDALGAVRAAVRGGVVPGGGVIYLWAHEDLMTAPSEDMKEYQPAWAAGWACVARALRSPLCTIARNAGFTANLIADEVLRRNQTSDEVVFFDAKSGNIGPRADIIDPTLVAVSVIRAAVSVATVLLTCEASITTIDRESLAPR